MGGSANQQPLVPAAAIKFKVSDAVALADKYTVADAYHGIVEGALSPRVPEASGWKTVTIIVIAWRSH